MKKKKYFNENLHASRLPNPSKHPIENESRNGKSEIVAQPTD